VGVKDSNGVNWVVPLTITTIQVAIPITISVGSCRDILFYGNISHNVSLQTRFRMRDKCSRCK
jgi:hypothetical protein